MNRILSSLLLIAALASKLTAQEGHFERIDFKAPSLQSHLAKEDDSKPIYVYLPPDYEKNSSTKYPVVYLLQGYTGESKSWFNLGGDSLMQLSHLNQMIKDKKIRPFIIVMPDGRNALEGAFYTNSIATGNWEDYIEKDLVQLIDARFRTIQNKDSRGIAGHSMGGYGALKIAMKHPDVFSAVYASSACCLALTESDNDYSEQDIKAAIEARSWEDFNKLQFFSKAIIASAAAWSPNPANPPFYADLPFSYRKNDSSAIEARYKMAANIPLWMIDQNITNLRQLKGISFDVGTHEASIKRYNIQFSNLLKKNKIPHQFVFFEGGHVDQLKNQLEKNLLPFFSKTLKF